jgi:AraC-like DNA-binding protein
LRKWVSGGITVADLNAAAGRHTLAAVIGNDGAGEALDLGSISRAAGLSAFHFARLFKAATGDSPFQFVTRTRMERAKELLRKTRLPISDIAERVGYQQPSHFSARFRSVLGRRPDAYRKLKRDFHYCLLRRAAEL